MSQAENILKGAQEGLDAFLACLILSIPREEGRALEPHLAETPRRVAEMFLNELLVGYRQDPREILKTDFPNGGYSGIVLVKGVRFFSTCPHHLLTVAGRAAVAYIPNLSANKIVGLSKLARLVECFARRLTTQEQMTEAVARTLYEVLDAQASACVLSATHSCMACRGVKQPEAVTVTSSLWGAFRDEPEARAEVMALIGTP